MLMRAIIGFVRPSSGTVLINDKILSKDIEFPESIGFLLETPSFLRQQPLKGQNLGRAPIGYVRSMTVIGLCIMNTGQGYQIFFAARQPDMEMCRWMKIPVTAGSMKLTR